MEQQAFTTRYAHFSPASWNQLPGWREDRLVEAWSVFQRSCSALGRKPAWDGPCARAASVSAASDAAIRQFFEREFALYEIRNSDRTPEGVITGYYEPLINGSRTQGGAFLYPVYAPPDDLLLLDIRLLPPNLRGRLVPARLDGRNVIPTPGSSGPYIIDVGNLQPDVRDKRLRLRLDGKRIVPYATRAEIERSGLPRARVLVWVDNPAAFYSMQIQGSGKVRLPDGRIVRLSYAEQNGHPFSPPVSRDPAVPQKGKISTRGLDLDLPEIEDGGAGTENQTAAPMTRGAGASPQPRQLPKATNRYRRMSRDWLKNWPPAGRQRAGCDRLVSSQALLRASMQHRIFRNQARNCWAPSRPIPATCSFAKSPMDRKVRSVRSACR